MVPAGTVIVAARSNDDTIYQINNKVVEGEMVSWFRSLMAIHTAGVGDDEMFGTPTPKAVGETWGVSQDEIRKFLKELGSPGDKERVSGGGRLESVDATHMVVSSSVEMNDMRLPLPDRFTATSGMATAEYLGRVPLSQTQKSRAVAGKIKLAVTGTRPSEGGDIKFEMTLNTESRYEVRPLIRQD
jgi:hypothetical protein